ncbi:MAG TPA: hypothetical protein VM686_32490, partial [Polyangiaceae bacterium]|nr:hypothetical protein [Polyangiaceae bacterium]
MISGQAGAAPTLRVQRDLRGDFVMFGNAAGYECGNGADDPVVGTVTCPGGNQTNQNDTSPDLFWRSEDPNSTSAVASNNIDWTEARTTAILSLPPGATIAYARIYWAGLVDDPAGADNAILLERPNGALSATITADDSATVDRANRLWYQSTADITAELVANGEGGYRVSGLATIDIRSTATEDPILGWVVVAIYQLPGDQPRNVAIFDGLDLVDNSSPQNVEISGFLVPDAFDAKLGVITYEGEDSLEGDSLEFNGFALSDNVNPEDNFFNSSRSNLGVPVSVDGDLPQLSGEANSMSGVDFDIVDVTDRLSPGDESASISATSTQDTFLLGAFVTSISTFRPNFETSNKAFEDLNGGSIKPGDVIEYTVVVENTGNDRSVQTVLTDALPPGVGYVPGSLALTSTDLSGALTDAAGDDRAEYDAATRTLTVRLGEGANAEDGGAMDPGESATVTFSVRVDGDFVGTISNQAIISAEGELGAPLADFPTDSDGDEPGSQPTDGVVQGCDEDADCSATAPLCNTGASPRVCVQCLSDDDCDGAASPDCRPNNTCGCAAGTGECADDADGDGLSDDEEETLGTDPDDADSDDDGVRDGAESLPGDDSDGDGLINALDADSDNDALFDGTELGLGCDGVDTDTDAGSCRADADDGATTTDPLDADSDDGGVSDGSEDSNLDGAMDAGETNPNNPVDDDLNVDSDGDGLSDAVEGTIGTDPNDADSDDDGATDGAEANPAEDSDGDDQINALDPDSDDDGLFDGTIA